MPTCRPPRPRCGWRRPTRWPSAARCSRRSRPTGTRRASRQPTATLASNAAYGRGGLLPAHRAGDRRLRAGRVGRNAPPDRVAGGAGRGAGLPARGRLSHAHGQHRAGRHPGGVAARPDRRHAPADLGCRRGCSRSCAGRTAWARSRCPTCWCRRRRLAQARLLLPPLERQLDQQRHLLATLTGRFPSEAIAANFQLGSFRLPRQLPLSLPADLVCQRPDVRAAEANVHAANAQIGVAIANRLPQITLTGNAGSTAWRSRTCSRPAPISG